MSATRIDVVVGWLGSPRVRRGLFLAAVPVGCFGWAMIFVGFSFAMVEHGARQWWLMPLFGLLTPVVAVGTAHGVLTLIRRVNGVPGPARPVAAPPDRSEAGGTAEVRRASTGSAQPDGSTARPPIEPLSRRELEVLEQLAAGRSNREIAKALYVAPGTVKAHLNHIFRKLSAASRLQAVARAREAGLLDDAYGQK